MSLSRKFTGALGIFVAALAGVNIVKSLSDSPAFVEAARVNGVLGEWRLQTGAALYDRSEYLFQLAFGFINADSTFSTAGEDIGQLAGGSLGIERADRAVSLLNESLRLSPGNANAWVALAEAHMARDDFENAYMALRKSWALAPNNANLSIARLGLAEAAMGLRQDAIDFELPEFAPPEFTEADLKSVANDVAIAQNFRKRDYDQFVERSIYVAPLAPES